MEVECPKCKAVVTVGKAPNGRLASHQVRGLNRCTVKSGRNPCCEFHAGFGCPTMLAEIERMVDLRESFQARLGEMSDAEFCKLLQEQ